MRRFRDDLRDDIKQQQIEEGRIFKAEKRRNRQPLDEKSFEEFKTVAGPKMVAFQQQLLRRKLLSRLPVFLAPVAVNAAALVTFTMTLRNLSTPPTPFSTEVFFLSDAALSQVDPFGVLPAAIGIVAMLNTEIRRGLAVTPVDTESADVGGRLSRFFEGLARVFSVAVIGFAMTNPVAVQIYWLTSFLFTSFESVLTARLERLRRERLSLKSSASSDAQDRAADTTSPVRKQRSNRQ